MKSFILVLIAVFSGFASQTGMVNGLVLDDSGTPVIGASVMVNGTNIGTMSDANGEYLLYNMETGVISITARMVGKASQTINGVDVIDGMTTRIDFTLRDETQGSTVITVSDQRQLIEYDEIETVHLISFDEFEKLPVASLQDFAGIMSGSVIAGGNLHIRGGRSGEVLYLVDGIPAQTGFLG